MDNRLRVSAGLGFIKGFGLQRVSLLVTMFFIAIFFEQFGELQKQNEIYKLSLDSLDKGMGAGVDYTRKAIEQNIEKHGLNRYILRRPDLIWPVMTPDEAYISCERGHRVFRGKSEWHDGIDIVVKYDLRVRAAHEGTVRTGFNKLYGNYILISSRDCITRYSHLSRIFVKSGQIKQGEVIGIVGRTGKTDGVHLDFEYYERGETLNPVVNTTRKQKVEL